MGEPNRKYVAKAIAGTGWRIWNRQQRKWWGVPFEAYPEALLEELNGLNRPERIIQLSKRQRRS
jgi:hypothetical protein